MYILQYSYWLIFNNHINDSLYQYSRTNVLSVPGLIGRVKGDRLAISGIRGEGITQHAVQCHLIAARKVVREDGGAVTVGKLIAAAGDASR
jgi:hypothetical protein